MYEMNWTEYKNTNMHEKCRLKEILNDNKAKADQVIKVLTFMVLIAFVVFKERV